MAAEAIWRIEVAATPKGIREPFSPSHEFGASKRVAEAVMMFALGVVIAGCPEVTPAEIQTPECQTSPPGGPLEEVPPVESNLPVVTGCSLFAVACFDELSNKRSGLVAFVPGARWAQTSLTWRLEKALPGFPEQDQLEVLDRAFAMWADDSALTFTQVDVDADIIISFESGGHGDHFPFAGANGVLGHAFFPSSRTPGVIHLNADRFASLDGSVGLDLFTAALHEIGHALGVEHLALGVVARVVHGLAGFLGVLDGLHDLQDARRL